MERREHDDGYGPAAPEAWRPEDNGYPRPAKSHRLGGDSLLRRNPYETVAAEQPSVQRPAMPQLWQDDGDNA